ncbi:MAG: hypothetical protein O6942_07055 [Bacteroidetes bacterium]|nr:hypothetical protein [Bacteroidota bacterium]
MKRGTMLVDVFLLFIETASKLPGREVLKFFQFDLGKNLESNFSPATRLHNKRSITTDVDEKLSSGEVG